MAGKVQTGGGGLLITGDPGNDRLLKRDQALERWATPQLGTVTRLDELFVGGRVVETFERDAGQRDAGKDASCIAWCESHLVG